MKRRHHNTLRLKAKFLGMSKRELKRRYRWRFLVTHEINDIRKIKGRIARTIREAVCPK